MINDSIQQIMLRHLFFKVLLNEHYFCAIYLLASCGIKYPRPYFLGQMSYWFDWQYSKEIRKSGILINLVLGGERVLELQQKRVQKSVSSMICVDQIKILLEEPLGLLK